MKQPGIMSRLLIVVLGVMLTLGFNLAQAGVTVTYYHSNALGSPVAATDEAGALLWTERYRPYGERIENQVSTQQNPLFYTGKPHDDDTGLTYFGARYYDPVVGRFMEMDPVGTDPGNIHSFNRYAYANNSPYMYVDPDGKESVGVGGWGGMNSVDVAMQNPVAVGQAETALVIMFSIATGSGIVGTVGDLLGLPLPTSLKGLAKVTKRAKLSGKNPPINQNRQKLHTNGTEGKSQFKDGFDADNLVQDAWRNGTPKFNKNGKLIGKVKQYKDEVGTQGQTSIDTRFSREHGVHGFPSNKKE